MPKIREYFYSLMTDKEQAPAAEVLKFILWIFSLIYELSVKILSDGYEKRFFTPYKADPKVISIGNITVGGTGKTQLVITVAEILESLGKRPSILIRGYGADEYMMLQEELRDCPILVGPDRVKNAKRSFYDFGADTVILDDGFQHWKMGRDLDIVLLDASNPFGNYKLIPRGILREPLTALRRADIIIATKVDAQPSKLGEIYDILDGMGKAGSVLESVYTPVDLYEVSGSEKVGIEFTAKKRICIVSSIGNPSYFRQKMTQLGAMVELEYTFMDHYNYKREDFYKIQDECKLLDIECIVVTKKDAVKIKRLALSNELTMPILALEVKFDIIKNRGLLNERLSRVYTS